MPEDIEFKGEQYSFYNGNYTYSDENNCDRWLFDDLYNVSNILNDEVKVIEEQQDIDIQAIKEFDRPSLAVNNFTSISEEIKYLHIAFNELLKGVKQLDRKIREER